MSKANRLARTAQKLDKLPRPLRMPVLSLGFGRMVRFFSTAGIRFEQASPDGVVQILRNRKKVQNHIGGVHAAATALLAESATGAAFGLNLPDDKLPLLKRMSINYVKRATGDLRAEARVNSEDLERILNDPKGSAVIQVTVTDEKGVEPVKCEMEWAWIPKKRSN